MGTILYSNDVRSMTALICSLEEMSEAFLRAHAVGQTKVVYRDNAVIGEFASLPGQTTPDLYGMLDAAYILYTLGMLGARTTREARSLWAKRILAYQDIDGWFSSHGPAYHPREHATAYAVGALALLGLEDDEDYIHLMSPLTGIFPILTDRAAFVRWITRMGFRLSPRDLLARRWGWHHVWLGSHVGAGVAATIGMTRSLLQDWTGGAADIGRWFDWYFDWLDGHVNPCTGYWQLGYWNFIIRRPTIIDMGGAVHFFWIYGATNRPFRYQEQAIGSTLGLQKETGLYKTYPYCIDLDANYCLVRAWRQLARDRQERLREDVLSALCANFTAVLRFLTGSPLSEIYSDLHGLPGALAALVECTKLPGFIYADYLAGWRHPLDRAWWL